MATNSSCLRRGKRRGSLISVRQAAIRLT
jgi:hypothetical protein